MPSPPRDLPEVPEEARQAAHTAVRAVAKRRSHHAPEPDGIGIQSFARAAVDAAAPAILAAERERRDKQWRSALSDHLLASGAPEHLAKLRKSEEVQVALFARLEDAADAVAALNTKGDTPMPELGREVPDGVERLACRRESADGERCGKPAEFIIWGKLFDKNALGPRCYDCAAEQVGHHGLAPGNPQGYAIHHLPNEDRALKAEAALEEARERVLGEIRDLAPHEISCTCGKGGEFDAAAHDDTCPRRQLAHVLDATTPPSRSSDLTPASGLARHVERASKEVRSWSGYSDPTPSLKEQVCEPMHVLASTIGRARVAAEEGPISADLDAAADAVKQLRVAFNVATGHEFPDIELERPELTDEERKRLLEIADILGAVHDPQADSRFHEDDARLVRRLAALDPSEQEQDGEPRKPDNCPKCGCRHWPWNRCGLWDVPPEPDCKPEQGGEDAPEFTVNAPEILPPDQYLEVAELVKRAHLKMQAAQPPALDVEEDRRKLDLTKVEEAIWNAYSEAHDLALAAVDTRPEWLFAAATKVVDLAGGSDVEEDREPPDSYWRPVPCGHPSDPVAMFSPSSDGKAVCHCGVILPAAELPQPPGAPGPIAHCQNCGCHVAIPTGKEGGARG